MVMLGALCAISIYQLVPSLPLAFVGAVVLVTWWGWSLSAWPCARSTTPVPHRPHHHHRGRRGVLIKGVAMLIWGKEAYTLPPFSGNAPSTWVSATILPQNLWVLGITAIPVAGPGGLLPPHPGGQGHAGLRL